MDLNPLSAPGAEADAAVLNARLAEAAARRDEVLAGRSKHAVDTRPGAPSSGWAQSRPKLPRSPTARKLSAAEVLVATSSGAPEPSSASAAASGHVFVVNSAVHKLHCDAFLCPGFMPNSTYLGGPIFAQWTRLLKGWPGIDCGGEAKTNGDGATHHRLHTKTDLESPAGLPRVACLKKWEQHGRPAQLPLPIFADVNTFKKPPGGGGGGGGGGGPSGAGSGRSSGDSSSAGPGPPPPGPSPASNEEVPILEAQRRAEEARVGALMETVRQFLAAARAAARRRAPLARRDRPLFALPVLGTGGGGGLSATGRVVRALLALLEAEVGVAVGRRRAATARECRQAAREVAVLACHGSLSQQAAPLIFQRPLFARIMAGLVAAARRGVRRGAGLRRRRDPQQRAGHPCRGASAEFCARPVNGEV